MTSICLIALTSSAPLNSGVGLGLLFGSPTSISAKFWGGSPSYDLGVGWGWGGWDWGWSGFHVHGDAHWHKPLRVEDANVVWYYGIGGTAYFWSDRYWHDGGWRSGGGAAIGPRIPFGIEWLLSDPSFDIFGELAPAILIGSPGFGPIIEGGIGIRYTFR